LSTEEYEPEIVEEAEEAEKLLDELIKRCEKADIEIEDESYREDFGVVDVHVCVHLKSGRKKREIYLYDHNDLKAFINIDFEKYIVIGNFAAIARFDHGTIEVAFGVIDDRPLSSRYMKRRILNRLGLKVSKEDEITPLKLESEHNIQIAFDYISEELQILTGVTKILPISLHIKHPKFSTHADALRILEKLTHSLFFEVEAETGISLILLRKRERKYSALGVRKNIDLEFPKYEYDEGPMSLYWYGRSAQNMPLLQFLAFYQCIEFYFLIYFNAEISKRVKAIIKEPSFRVDRESDLAKIVSATRPRGGSTASERDQLKATLRECIDEQIVIDFLEENEARAEHLNAKLKGITACTINPKNKGVPLVDQVAERIYAIRCSVVHVKADDGDADVELLLPYTEEAEKLDHDIQLVRLLARKVLVASSSPLRV